MGMETMLAGPEQPVVGEDYVSTTFMFQQDL
jgi:hypothetical protein